MNRRYSAIKILPFIVDYNLDVDEFAKSAFAFKPSMSSSFAP